MSLINKVAAIIDSKKPIDEVTYLEKRVRYDDTISILDIDLKTIIPAPAKNSSLTTGKELSEISRLTKIRTNKEIDLIRSVDRDPLELYLGLLKKNGLVFPQALFNDYYNIIEQYMYALKFYYNRARPEQLAPYFNLDIDVLYTETHHTPSYPSGHMMYSELVAHVLSDKYPEFKDKFFELSNYCGYARILQGVHYASDNKVSRIVVEKLYKLIKGISDDKESKKLSID